MVVSNLSDYTVKLFPESYLSDDGRLASAFLDMLVATAQICSARVKTFCRNHGVTGMYEHVASVVAGI